MNTIFDEEEFQTEKRVNITSLLISSLFLLLAVSINILDIRDFKDSSSVSNYFGIGFYFLYHAVLFFLLRKHLYHSIIKYFTILVAITTVTIILYGYHFGIDWIHTARADTVAAYFFAIILAGYYRHPRLAFYSSIIVSIQYSWLYLNAALSGTRIYLQTETFRENILTWDTLAVYLILFVSSGILMSLNTRRQRILLTKLCYSYSRADFLENFDNLTKLPNSLNFIEELNSQIDKAVGRKQIFAIMCLGIDKFRSIKHLYGKSNCDLLLQMTSNRLSAAFREDDFIARFRGDKFLLLFADIKHDYNVLEIIRKTEKVFEKPFTVGTNEIVLTTGTGICTYPADGSSSEEIIKNAEAAMYSAKKLGKGKFMLFNKSGQETLDLNLKIEKELESAVKRKEFSLVYQPKTDVNGSIKGLECLLRWNNSELGIINPDVFIPIAEQSGLIVDIGYEVLRMCAKQIRQWRKNGLPKTPVTVNVSAVQFGEPDFVETLRIILDEYEIEEGWLGIEITETGIMENEADCVTKLTELHESGLSISIDDFGKGYSSLSRLGTYPLDTLKIDKSFIDAIPESDTSSCLVRSIIDIGQNLDYKVVAEGVEQKKQIDFLQVNGCSCFQGFYYYKPMPADEVEKLITK